MANAVETLVANSPIQSPVDKYYNFFKFDMNEIIKIFPAAYTGVELLEGEDGVVGNVKLWHYILGIVYMKCHVWILTFTSLYFITLCQIVKTRQDMNYLVAYYSQLFFKRLNLIDFFCPELSVQLRFF